MPNRSLYLRTDICQHDPRCFDAIFVFLLKGLHTPPCMKSAAKGVIDGCEGQLHNLKTILAFAE